MNLYNYFPNLSPLCFSAKFCHYQCKKSWTTFVIFIPKYLVFSWCQWHYFLNFIFNCLLLAYKKGTDLLVDVLKILWYFLYVQWYHLQTATVSLLPSLIFASCIHYLIRIARTSQYYVKQKLQKWLSFSCSWF